MDVLGNGLTLVNAPIAGNNNVSIQVVVRRGSRDELASEAGLTQLLTQLFFRATARRPDSEELLAEIEGLGAEMDARVTGGSAVLSVTGPASEAPRLMELMADLVCNARLDPADIDVERQLLLDGIAARNGEPSKWLQDNLPAAAFAPGDPAARPVFGDPRVLRHATRDALVDFRRRLFDPRSTAVVVSGGAGVAAADAERLLGGLTPQQSRPRRRPRWNRSGSPWRAQLRPTAPGDRPKSNVAVLLPGLTSDDPDAAALTMLTLILGGSMSARLFSEVRDKRGLCYTVGCQAVPMPDAGLFLISTSAEPDRVVEAVRVAVDQLREIAGPRPATSEEMESARRQAAFMLARQSETAAERGGFYAGRWLAGKPLVTPHERAAELAAVTPDEVGAVARRLVAALAEARVVFTAPSNLGPRFVQAVGGVSGPAQREVA